MLSEAAALKQIADELKAQHKKFQELPKLRQLIEVEQHYQDVEWEAKRHEIDFYPYSNGYACDDQGQVIGLFLFNVSLTDYDLLQNFPHLTWVSLNINRFKEITFLVGLKQLSRLTLKGDQICDLTPLNELTQISQIYLPSNQISDLTPLRNLTQLRQLDLANNHISDLTPLAGLTHLTQLFLGKNQIVDLTPLRDLTQLTQLNLSDNQIRDLTPLRDLTQLTQLNLSDNQIRDLTPLRDLTQLMQLKLSDNQISDLTPLSGLTKIMRFDLHNNRIHDLSPLSRLTYLVKIDLHSNQVRDLSSLSDLTQLTQLDLRSNQINDIAPLNGLSQLRSVDVSHNQIMRLPKAFTESDREIHWDNRLFFFDDDYGINLYGNPLESPPVEILQQGEQAIIAWFKSIEGEPLPLNEVKVLLVGDGGAGKTSLGKRLVGGLFDRNEPQTHGIKIRHNEIEVGKSKIKVHFWDFGGQEILHATHQFFLSKRSLYILVLDSRKDDKTEYWLKHIESFGGDSPVLVVLNKIDEHPGFDVNRRFLQEKYPAIQGFHRISCATGTGFREFSDNLKKALTTVELLHTTWPKTWFIVKTRLEQNQEHFISYDYYQKICMEEKVTEKTAQDTLVDFLHDLGVILHFKDIELLDTQVLNPKWVTDAVYRIINSAQLATSKGMLRLKFLDTILQSKTTDDYQYSRDKYRYIIELMKKFELCYELDDHDWVLIPDLLDVPEPAFDFDYTITLKFRLQYDFLPRSILPRFIVRRHRDIRDELRWRTGVVLQDVDLRAVAVVKADHEERVISLWVQGERRREYFAILRKTFQDIHASFEKLDVIELVPLPDHPEITVDYQELIGLERMGESTITIGKLHKKYQVAELLDGLEVRHDRRSEFIAFLLSLPNIEDHNVQRGLLARANLPPRAQSQIQCNVPVAQFVPLLVDTLQRYGQLEDGRPAFVAVLQAARDLVGQEGRARCDRLIREIQS